MSGYGKSSVAQMVEKYHVVGNSYKKFKNQTAGRCGKRKKAALKLCIMFFIFTN